MYRMLADAEVAEKISSSQENFSLLEESPWKDIISLYFEFVKRKKVNIHF